MTTEEKTKPVTDLFEQAMKSYEQALKTGMKLQEDSAKCFSNLVSQTTTPQDWQKRMKTMTHDFIPQSQKNVDEALKIIEQTGKTSIELLKKAVESGQSVSVQDAQTKFLGLWEASLNAMRDTALSVTQANQKSIESWLAYVRKTTEPAMAGAKS
jgi:hypothetical protein